MKPQDPLQIIQALCHRYSVRSIRWIESGQNSHIAVLDERWLVKIPRYPSVLSDLKAEWKLLSALPKDLPLPVPQPVRQELDSPFPAAYALYTYLPGESAACLQGCSSDLLPTAAEQIACFLRAFHHLSVPGLPAVCAEENRAAWQDFLVRLRKKVLPLLPPKAASAVADRFTAFLSDPHSFSYTPVLTHRDLGCSNLLYDSGTNRLCGVIDFGQSGFDDPALDLASLICPASFGKEFAPILLKYWPEAETFLPRAEFYIWTFPLQDALFGAENGDDAALQSGIAPFLSEKG
ncbi:MAG: phosphotransferase [Oscillospiraceae bacterium]|nr:phosphotransferase [Oscillospiraceae bacterium]MBQ7082392.1 phosphotransferase [Oscillospiraceae bacterium]